MHQTLDVNADALERFCSNQKITARFETAELRQKVRVMGTRRKAKSFAELFCTEMGHGI